MRVDHKEGFSPCACKQSNKVSASLATSESSSDKRKDEECTIRHSGKRCGVYDGANNIPSSS